MTAFLAKGLGTLALSGALAAGPFAAEPGSKPAETRSLASRLNPFAEKPAPAPAAVEPVRPVAAPPAKPVGPLSPETMLDVLREEQDAYTRRLEVCTQLRIVAVDKRDEALLAKVDEMEKLAEITYKTRLSRLGVKSQLRSNPSSEEFERAFGAAKTPPLESGVRTPAEARPATAQLKNFREVKP